MSDSALAPPTHKSTPGLWPWCLAVLGSSLAAIYGVILASETVSRYFHGWIGARTIAGILLVTLGFLGPLIPILLLICRRRIFDWTTLGQWTAAVAVPIAYLLALGAAGMAIEKIRSPLLVLPPPATPYTLTIHVSPTGAVSCTGTPATPQESATVRGSGNAKSIDFEFLSGPERIMKLTGTRELLDEDRLEIAANLEVQAGKVRLEMNRLADVKVTADGAEPPHEFVPGKYKLLIQGRLVR